MRTDLFDYELPPARVALRPAVPRDAAKLLVVRPHAAPEFEDRTIRDLPALLQPGDALVVNDSKVIPARLVGERTRGEARAKIETTLIRREGNERWRALAKPAKRLKPGDRIRFGHESRVCLLGALDATVEEIGEGGEVLLRFDFHGPVLEEAIEALGHMPLPPYIAARREDDEQDRGDYQTIFAKPEGSVAAPTAGLHFTNELLAALDARGISLHRLTLHVGTGTFLPVKAEDTAGHRMHAEWGEISAATAAALQETRARKGRIVAVGTTALRLLESAAGEDGKLAAFSGETSIFITPGYRFRAVDALVTNFHLPRSTLFMLVAAFSGLERMRRAYRHAIETGYRFYSYGDACLLYPDPETKR
ncbi:MAG TPA: tRNA preQ1(34) S-adenosylmethionine ribosyltransferase-isomerase QueA [Xanthobacteraceae bacterium]|nr:tRNA preQ1(34) S-adenosylmethionine ribosyltransferase-isomerase QueA [Xanthobacteraceae bacterium]